MKLWKFIKKLFKPLNFKILLLFLTWRISLFVILSLALFIPLQSHNFLGGGYKNYLKQPFVFAWANFDGEHYLSISQKGYEKLNYSFFPFYPFLMSFFSLRSADLMVLTIIGLVISNLSFLCCLFFLWKLIQIDYVKKIAWWAVVVMVLFPTSFYFGAVYTEALFLLLILASFYCARVKRWWLAGILGALASATRVTGIFLFPALLLEWWLQKSGKLPLPIFIIPLGLLVYMFYLNQTTGSFFTFYQELSTFGVQRAGNFILLPQVFYRYLNMLFTINPANIIYWTIILEFTAAILGIVLLIWGYIKKVRLSYLLFGVLSFILPTLTGSFSSLPRYVMVIFPIFLALAIFLSTKSKMTILVIYGIFLVLLIFETTLFLRGYWVA